MTAGEYWKRVNSLAPTWTFTNPTNPEIYKQSIKTSTTELTKSQKEGAWELLWDEHEVYLGI